MRVKLFRSKIYFRNVRIDNHPPRVSEFFRNDDSGVSSFHYNLDDQINDFLEENPNIELVQIHFPTSIANSSGEVDEIALIEYEEKSNDQQLELEGKQILERVLKDIDILAAETDSEGEKSELKIIGDCVEKYMEKRK